MHMYVYVCVVDINAEFSIIQFVGKIGNEQKRCQNQTIQQFNNVYERIQFNQYAMTQTAILILTIKLDEQQFKMVAKLIQL